MTKFTLVNTSVSTDTHVSCQCFNYILTCVESSFSNLALDLL